MSYLPQNTIYVKAGDGLVGIVAAALNNTRIVLEPGTHTLAAPLVINNKTNFTIEGGPDSILSSSLVAGIAVDVQSCTNLTLRGFRLTSLAGAIGIEFNTTACYRVSLLDLHVETNNSQAVRVNVDTFGLLIRGCTIRTQSYPINLNGGTNVRDVRIEGNFLQYYTGAYSGGRGINLSTITNLSDVVIVGNNIDGFTIGIDLSVGTRVAITGNTINNSNNYSIRITGATVIDVSIVGNTCNYTATSYGIQIASNSGVVCCANTIRGAASHGIYVQTGGNHTVSNNVIYDPAGSGIWLSAAYVAVKGNRIYSAGAFGIYSQANSNLTIEGNVIDASVSEPIELVTVTDSVIESNICNDCGGDGIECITSCARLVIRNNEVTLSALHALRINACDDMEIGGNLFNDNDSGDMVEISSSEHIILSNNMLRDAAARGVYVNNSPHCMIDGGMIDTTVGVAIQISGTSNYCEIRNVHIDAAGGDAIYVSATPTHAIVSTNTIVDATTDAIYVDSDYSQITGNKIHNPGQDGISLFGGCTDVEVAGNHINAAGRDGIRVDGGCTNVNLSANAIYGSTSDGIELVDCDESVVQGNRAQGCGGYGVVEAAACDNNLFDSNHWRGNTTGATSYNGTNRTVGTEKT